MLNNIDETIDTAIPDPDLKQRVVAALTARENEMADAIREIATKFNVMPQVVAKVILTVGLGEHSPEVREYVNAQYADLLAQIETARQAKIAGLQAMGLSVEIEPFVDPLAEYEES